jgi:WD40 repeat protein
MLANRAVWKEGCELVFSPDGTVLAAAARDGTGTALLWDVASGERLATLQTGTRFIAALAFSPDGTQLVGGLDDGGVALWDAATGEQVRVRSSADLVSRGTNSASSAFRVW